MTREEIQIDRSNGQGHCWTACDENSLPDQILQDIEAEAIDGGRDECGDYIASNGQHYRW